MASSVPVSPSFAARQPPALPRLNSPLQFLRDCLPNQTHFGKSEYSNDSFEGNTTVPNFQDLIANLGR
jgi:hypothetical protein